MEDITEPATEKLVVPERILELVDRFESDIDKYRSIPYNEEDIKNAFINPLFEALGWDVGNKTNKPPDLREVKFEDSVDVQGRIKNPDYSFRLDRARKFFAEAKKPAVDIEGGMNPAFQLRSYAWSANLPVSILTDFEEFAVYDCRSQPFKFDKPTNSRLFIVKLRRRTPQQSWRGMQGAAAGQSKSKRFICLYPSFSSEVPCCSM